MKKSWSCSCLAWLRYFSCLEFLLIETLNLRLCVFPQTFGIIVLSWHMMRTWEETQAESEFKKRKIFRGIWCHDCRHIAPSCHDMTRTKHITPPRSLGWIRRWKGDGDLCDDEAVRDVLSKCPSPLPHSVPILASPDPDCERFSFRTFWICCAVTVNCTSLALNLRWVAWVILFHLRFLFIRLPSTRRCGLAETVGLCFRVDSDCATLGFVLGLVCVCVTSEQM